MQNRLMLLLADSMHSTRSSMRALFEDHFDVILEATNGQQALELIEQHRANLSAVVLDASLTGHDGYHVLSRMRQTGLLQEIPTRLLSSDVAGESEARALEIGAWDYILRPCSNYVLLRRLQNAVRACQSRRTLEQRVSALSQSADLMDDTIVNTLATVTEFRSVESGQHILRIRKFTAILLEEVARSCPEYELTAADIARISSASALHDIGKISIPDAILNKPHRLTEEEYEVIKTHPVAGCEILATMTDAVDTDYLRYAWNICRYHHERWDGGGYPEGLKGNNIPICAQVVALADVYDALTSIRVYKDAYDHASSVNMILSGDCGVFNPRLLECFKHVHMKLAELARNYADGLTPVWENLPLPSPTSFSSESTALNLALSKYHTLLSYVGSVVTEVNMQQGTHHLVFDSSEDFAALRGSRPFPEAMRQLIEQSVHPEDRETALQQLTFFEQEFFEQGLRRHSRTYRVYSTLRGEYLPYTCDLLRIEIGPHVQRALVVWAEASGKQEAQLSEALPLSENERLLTSMTGGVIRCRNDRWYTVVEGAAALASLLGYTEEELSALYHDHLLEMVVPEDRHSLTAVTVSRLERGRSVTGEFRLSAKDGRIVWVQGTCQLVVGEDGFEYVCCILRDQTRQKEQQESLQAELERHKILLAQTDDIILDWNVSEGTIAYSGNFEPIFGYPPILGAYQDAVLGGTLRVHADDLATVRQELEELARTRRALDLPFRVLRQDESELWCRLRASLQRDESGRSISLVGRLVNIDADHRQLLALREQAERDPLTQLYNKAASRRLIEEYFDNRKPGETAALIVLDLDNFKNVNDRYGHLVGDNELIRCAMTFHRLFRSSDIVARIGGDEFLVLAAGMERDLVARRCQDMLDIFSRDMSREMKECGLSCSIGIAMAPEDGLAFQELFQRADKALYQAKGEGKGGFAFYDPTAVLTDATFVSTRIDSNDRVADATHGLANYAFRRLYESGNVEEAIREILAAVGRQMNVSRVYIFENNEDNTTCSNTFEWCNRNIEPMIDHLQNISYLDELKGYSDNFNEHGVFYMRSLDEMNPAVRAILEPQGIRSMLQCAIRDNGVFRGYVGFDECSEDRIWTQDQVSVLTTIAELTVVFLLKQRAQDAALRWLQDVNSVLDRYPAWVYVIDHKSCELLFVNEKTRNLVPHVKPGMLCHKVLMGREERCPNCPAHDLGPHDHQTANFYNEILDLRVRSDASAIRWSGRDAAMIVCREISMHEWKKLGEKAAFGTSE